MQDVAIPTQQDRIIEIVRKFIPTGSKVQPIYKDNNLQVLGLTSLDMVNLMLAIEAEFELTIPGSKLTPANFRSPASIDALLSELL